MNELLIHTTWINLKCILLSERSQTKNGTICVIQFTRYYGKDKKLPSKLTSKLVCARVWEGRED